ncbi:tetratricopeptide repeat protein [Myceligenerans indicum]|uniref:Tetratricopeptide repeat protein n=1 Tax=Myceligenerans indicum TaxID=2593663 RepID=A0ABS1LHL7_9MICO|nr:tetratricopeptide repeat protein [Myceligenerans indicum]MBL0885734.1 tetratricopeptide repeat protein [Myceligenerans indicum]
MGLLEPALRVVPFSGRDTEMADLTTWAGGAETIRARLLTGLGGSGKSRIAVELSARLSRRRWRSVWLDPADEPGDVAEACRGPRVLVVVDDAASFPRLDHQLGAIRKADAGRVRVLLLARTGREWWTRLRWASPLWADPVTVPTSIVHIGPPALTPDRMVRNAVAAFAPRLGVPVPDLVVCDLPADADPPRFGDVHAAALAVLAERDEAEAEAVVDVARGPAALLDQERNRWEDTDAVVARALLCGDRRDLPDRLAELHVARTLQAAPGMTEVCTARITSAEAFEAAMFAFRLDVDTPAVTGAGRLTAALLERVIPQLSDDPAHLEGVLRLFPARPAPTGQASDVASRLVTALAADDGQDTTTLAEALGAWARALEETGRSDDALEPAERAEAMWRRITAADPLRYRVALWRAMRDLAVVSFGSGRDEQFEALVDETVSAWSSVPEAEAVWTDPELAWGLYSLELTTRPADVDAARWYHERAVAILRDLVAQDPVAYEETLARVQANLLLLVNRGRPAEALDGLRESVAIRRRLARDRPDAFERHLAYSLSNLSHALAALGAAAEALAAGQEALALRRRAVRKAAASGRGGAPRLRFELAWSLSGVGVLLSEQGRPHEALSLEEEALTIRRELAREAPDRYREMLATSCSNLGVTYSRLGRFGDALCLEQEAVGIRRELVRNFSAGRHRQHLARSLSNLGVRYSDMGRTEDAVEPTREAVSLMRQVVRDDRRQHLPDLATALANLGATLTDLSRAQEAVGPLHEAVGALRDLSRESPQKHLPGLASALTALAVALGEQRRYASAAAAAREAVRIRDRLAATDQRRFGDDLARSVRVLAGIEALLPQRGSRNGHYIAARSERV